MDFTLSVTGSEFSPATGERTFIVMVKEKEGSVGSRLQEVSVGLSCDFDELAPVFIACFCQFRFV